MLIFLPMGKKNKFYPQKMYVCNPSNQDAEAGVQGQPSFGGVFFGVLWGVLGGEGGGEHQGFYVALTVLACPKLRELPASASKCTCMHIVHTNNEIVTKDILKTE